MNKTSMDCKVFLSVDSLKTELDEKIKSYKKVLNEILHTHLADYLEDYFKGNHEDIENSIRNALVYQVEKIHFAVNRPFSKERKIGIEPLIEKCFFEKRFFGLFKKQITYQEINYNEFTLFVCDPLYQSNRDIFYEVLQEKPGLLKNVEKQLQTIHPNITVELTDKEMLITLSLNK